MPPEFNFSKSKYCEYWQCPKMAWLRQHLPDKAEEDPSAIMRMEAGRNVAEITRRLFGDYVDVSAFKDGKPDLAAMEAATIRAMQRGVPTICEASFCYNGLFCAVDILKQENGGWAIYEVKSGTKPTKGVYIADVAYQLYVLECLKLPVTSVYIVSLNRNYIFDGKLKPRKLFKITDVTDRARAETNTVYNNLLQAIKLLPYEEEPDIPISRACRNPYPCPFRNYCLSELPATTEKNPRPEYTDKVNIARFLRQLHYPLYFLDFETFMSAIPIYLGTRPYDQVPFQYSLHYIEEEGGALQHKEYLADPKFDPRREIAEKLCDDIPEWACVIAYNKTFECTRLVELAVAFPDLATHLLAIERHIVDLMVPFKNGWLYRKAMGDSYSIKSVLPALFPSDPDLDYTKLEGVHNGNEAMTAFPGMLSMTPEEQEKTRNNLLKYCELDTLAMVKIWEKLNKTVAEK